MMDKCEPCKQTNIRQLVKMLYTAFCPVDPMATWLVNDGLCVLISSIINKLNRSLPLNVFTRPMKAAPVKPLITKQSLDYNSISNYRPLQKLPFHLML